MPKKEIYIIIILSENVKKNLDFIFSTKNKYLIKLKEIFSSKIRNRAAFKLK